MKKKYDAPKMEVQEVEASPMLIAGSGDDDMVGIGIEMGGESNEFD